MLIHQVSTLLTYRSDNAQNVTGAGVITKQMKIDGFTIGHYASNHNLGMLYVRHHVKLAKIIFQYSLKVFTVIGPRADKALLLHAQIETHALAHGLATAQAKGQDATSACASNPIKHVNNGCA